MMWQEFERIAGYEVSYEDYTKIIEPMYNATNLSKQEFVKVLDRKQFDLGYKRKVEEKRLISRMKEISQDMKDLCGRTTTYDEYEELRKVARQYIDEFPLWMAPHHEFETAYGYGNCTYVKALIWYDHNWNEVKRIELVA